MSKVKDIDKIHKHKNLSIAKISSLIDDFMEIDPMKADKFCYWLDNYSEFLGYENKFNPRNLKRYKRGEVVKAHLGFKIGSEEGGLHYCIVLDKDNALSSPIITVVPLTSLKSNKDINNLRKGELYLGNSLYQTLKNKYDKLLKKIVDKTMNITEDNNNDGNLQEIENYIALAKNICTEIDRMKSGSIALIGQITTISKIRIYDPKNKYDVLANVRLPNEALDKIDNEIEKLFIGKK